MTAHLDDHSTDRLEQALHSAELEIARLRVSQSVILSELDRRQVAMADGARTLAEWTAAAPTNGETGVWLASGTRVSPATLERILCEGAVEVTALTTDGTPLTVGN